MEIVINIMDIIIVISDGIADDNDSHFLGNQGDATADGREGGEL